MSPGPVRRPGSMHDPITSEPAAASLPLAAFDYDLPPELIAQTPAERRDGARLLVLDRSGTARSPTAAITDLPELLAPGDLLVFNDTRVRPARLFGRIDDRRRGRAAAGRASGRAAPGSASGGRRAACARGRASRCRRARTRRCSERLGAGPVCGGGRRDRRRRRPAGAARRAAAAALHPAPRRSAADRRRALSDGLRARAPAPSPRRPRVCTSRPALLDALAARGIAHAFAHPRCRAGDVPAAARGRRRDQPRRRVGDASPPRPSRRSRGRGPRAAAWSRSAPPRRAPSNRPRRAPAGSRPGASGPTRSSDRASASPSSTPCSRTSTCRARRC